MTEGSGDTRDPRLHPLVLHYRTSFLAPSETFIRTVITVRARYRAVVLAHETRGDEGVPEGTSLRVEPYSANRAAAFGRTWLPAERIRQRRHALTRGLSSLRPDVVHAHFAEEGIAALGPARRARIPLVVTFYGHDATSLPRHPAWRRRIRRMLRGATLVLAEGPHLRSRLVELGSPADRTRVQPIPVRLEMFPYREPAAHQDVTVLQACRFVPKKGVDLTLRAFAGASGGTSTRLDLIGDGPERPRLEELARQLGIAERVRFLGMRTHAQYARDLAQADIFIQPSRFGPNGDGEGGAPTTLLEAQAVGLPIVSTTHADIPFVTSRDGALLAAEEDVDQLTSHLHRLLRHPEEWPGRARAGRRHVERQHDAIVLATQLEAAYDDARAMVAAEDAS